MLVMINQEGQSSGAVGSDLRFLWGSSILMAITRRTGDKLERILACNNIKPWTVFPLFLIVIVFYRHPVADLANEFDRQRYFISNFMGIFIGLQPGFESKIDSQELSRFFEIERSVAHQGFDGRTCWVHARAGVIPPEARQENGRTAQVVMTSQKLLLSGSDVFYSLHQTTSVDSGRSWSPMEPLDRFARKRLGDQFSAGNQGDGIASDLVQTGDELLVCDFTPQWHSASQRLLGVGQTVWYRGNGVLPIRPRSIAYACYDSKQTRWSDWQSLELPKEERFKNAGAGSAQRVDLVGGDILIPFYFKEPQEKQYSVAVCRCRFDGKKLYYLKHGNELSLGIDRGLFEPSLTRFQNRFYLTLRNDRHGYVSTSEDGLHFNEPVRWHFDDGKDLGNYNTQQHWVTHSEKLFLVYTRRGAKNDHVFRHRAPLFIAEVDPEGGTGDRTGFDRGKRCAAWKFWYHQNL